MAPTCPRARSQSWCCSPQLSTPVSSPNDSHNPSLLPVQTDLDAQTEPSAVPTRTRRSPTPLWVFRTPVTRNFGQPLAPTPNPHERETLHAHHCTRHQDGPASRTARLTQPRIRVRRHRRKVAWRPSRTGYLVHRSCHSRQTHTRRTIIKLKSGVICRKERAVRSDPRSPASALIPTTSLNRPVEGRTTPHHQRQSQSSPRCSARTPDQLSPQSRTVRGARTTERGSDLAGQTKFVDTRNA